MTRMRKFTQVWWRCLPIVAALALPVPLAAEGVKATEGPDSAQARVDPAASQTLTNDLGISAYEPVYFSLGFNERIHAKFQISLQFRPFGETDDSIPGEHVWDDMFMGFTQTSIWDLQSDSKPFFDSAYRPSLFYQRREIGKFLGGRFGVRAGFEHESNGKGGLDSRSINILFIRPSWWWNLDEKWALAFTPKVYTYIEKSENPDIADFRGHVDWGLSIAQDRGIRVAATVRVGSDGRVSTLVDFSYPFQDITPLRRLGFKHGYFHVQYFEGYGESIIAYNQRLPWQLRVGLMIVR